MENNNVHKETDVMIVHIKCEIFAIILNAHKILNFAWVNYTILYEYNITNKYFIT